MGDGLAYLVGRTRCACRYQIELGSRTIDQESLKRLLVVRVRQHNKIDILRGYTMSKIYTEICNNMRTLGLRLLPKSAHATPPTRQHDKP